MTPSGLAAGDGWVNAPTDLPGFGDIQWENMQGRDQSRAMVGGPGWGEDGSGFNPSTGFNRISTGEQLAQPIPGGSTAQLTNWSNLFNWKHSPSFWILVFALAAVGVIHARVNVRAGRAQAGAGF